LAVLPRRGRAAIALLLASASLTVVTARRDREADGGRRSEDRACAGTDFSVAGGRGDGGRKRCRRDAIQEATETAIARDRDRTRRQACGICGKTAGEQQ
jgi:hypothetical protein